MASKSPKTLTLVNFLSEFSNDLKCHSIMGEKMFFMVSSSKDSIPMILKCLRNLGVTLFLPPPGGPMADTITMSISSRTLVSFLSNQYPWSIHWRRISMGGWAPYFSLAGMFRSSTNTISFFPSVGPYTPFFRLKYTTVCKFKFYEPFNKLLSNKVFFHLILFKSFDNFFIYSIWGHSIWDKNWNSWLEKTPKIGPL